MLVKTVERACEDHLQELGPDFSDYCIVEATEALDAIEDAIHILIDTADFIKRNYLN